VSFEVLSDGHVLVEAPRPDPTPPGGVLFSDVVAGGVHRWTPDGAVVTVLPARRGVGGLVPHAAGGIVVTGRDVRHDDELLLGASPGVTGYNDLVTDDAGGVLVGALRFRPMAGEAPVPGALWRIPPGDPAAHPPHVVLGGLLWPNGVGLSPDGATLYVSDFAAGEVVAADAHGGGRRTFARVPDGAAPDGLAVDAEGGVWVALGPAAQVGRFAPDGRLDALVDVPANFVSSVAFDGDRLLVATAGALLRTDAGVAGRPVPAARTGVRPGGTSRAG
jgi:sugar lactone lactonase YvrE